MGSESKYDELWYLNCVPKNSAYMFHMQDTAHSSLPDCSGGKICCSKRKSLKIYGTVKIDRNPGDRTCQ